MSEKLSNDFIHEMIYNGFIKWWDLGKVVIESSKDGHLSIFWVSKIIFNKDEYYFKFKDNPYAVMENKCFHRNMFDIGMMRGVLRKSLNN